MAIATSVDDPMTSQSIEGRRDFNDFEMLDAKMASALKKIISSVHFRRRVSVDERRAQISDRFSRGRQIACMIYDHFRATGPYDAAQGLSDLFNIEDFGTRWDQAPLPASEIPTENVLEGLYKMKIRDSVQLQTVLIMYGQEIVRDRLMRSCSRLKTLIRRHVDQMSRTRNERIET